MRGKKLINARAFKIKYLRYKKFAKHDKKRCGKNNILIISVFSFFWYDTVPRFNRHDKVITIVFIYVYIEQSDHMRSH